MVFLNKYIFFSIIIIVVTSSCKDKLFTSDVNCDECYDPKPDSIYLTIHTTLNDQYPEVSVLLYNGNIDSGEFIDTFFCYIENSVEYNQIYVKADRDYSAKAIYKTEERTVFVVDGTKQKLKRVSDFCEDRSTCWVSENDELFLELAY